MKPFITRQRSLFLAASIGHNLSRPKGAEASTPYLDVYRPFRKGRYRETPTDLVAMKASRQETAAHIRSHFDQLNLAGPKHIALIACSASKASHRTCAEHLYTGNLFLKAKDFAEAHCDGFFILSARHGLLTPTQEVEPYNHTMTQMNRSARESWAQKVVSSITWHIPHGSTITLLAGSAYCQPIEQQLQAAGFLLKRPLKSLGIGQQQRKLMDMLANSQLE